MSIIDSLITNRTTADVQALKSLKIKVAAGTASAAEIAEYLNDQKGAYNASDLNRVGEAVNYLAGLLSGYGYSVQVNAKTDWQSTDIPTAENMQTYLRNVQRIRNALSVLSLPSVPGSMRGLTAAQANSIEAVLGQVDTLISNMVAEFRHSGTIFSNSGMGGVRL